MFDHLTPLQRGTSRCLQGASCIPSFLTPTKTKKTIKHLGNTFKILFCWSHPSQNVWQCMTVKPHSGGFLVKFLHQLKLRWKKGANHQWIRLRERLNRKPWEFSHEIWHFCPVRVFPWKPIHGINQWIWFSTGKPRGNHGVLPSNIGGIPVNFPI